MEALAGELLAPGSVFAFLAKHRGRLFLDAMMEDLLPSRRGWHSVPARHRLNGRVTGSMLVLQALQGISDRETAGPGDAVRAGLGPCCLIDGELIEGEPARNRRAQRPGLDHRSMTGVGEGGAVQRCQPGLPRLVAAVVRPEMGCAGVFAIGTLGSVGSRTIPVHSGSACGCHSRY